MAVPELKNYLRPDWNAPANVNAVVTTRRGGVSQGVYHGFNVGQHVGDSAETVAQNRQQLLTDLALPQAPVWLNQQHTANIQTDQQSFAGKPCDGMVTGRSAVVCAVMTADCMPVLICNQQGTAVAAVHAGWRGLAAGIVESALAEFAEPSDQLLVWAGPTISIEHFEVGPEVRESLQGSEDCYRPSDGKPGHYYADLYRILGERMTDLGAQYSHSSHCTFRDKSLFYSYRRDGVTGRMVSLIWMNGDRG